MKRLIRYKSLAALQILIFCLSSCAFVSHDVLPEKKVSVASQIEPSILDGKANEAISDKWWMILDDQQLNKLIDLGLQKSPNLEISGATILAAQAMLEGERAAFVPQFGLAGQVDRQELSRNYIFVPGMPVYTGYGLVNASLNWSLDLWGKQKKYYEAAKNQLRAAQANHQAATLLLSTTITRIYLDFDRAAQSQNLYERDAQVKKNLLQIAQDKYRVGLIDLYTLNQKKIDVETAESYLAQSALTKKLIQHQLAALVQEGPSWGERLTSPHLDYAALNLPEVIPSNLLERRPDLQSLLSQIDVARLQLEGAQLEYLPDINLAGYFGVQSFGLSQLFKPLSQQFSIGPSLSLPIFDGGLISANITGKEANRNQAIANYQEQLVQALREVSDGLASVKTSEANYLSYRNAYQNAKSNFEIYKQRSLVGINSKESVIINEELFLAQAQNLIDAKAKAFTANVVLVQALGGSYWSAKSPDDSK
jgi:NodT family efflux transporter outer membrane factor (OMF) lipoprotein